MSPNGLKGRLQLRTESSERSGRAIQRSLCLFCLSEFEKRGLPSLLQFRRHQAIVWINPSELTLGESRFIAQTFQMLLMGMDNLLNGGVLCGKRSRIHISFHWRERLKKALHHLQINGICWNVLTDRDTILLA
jgi:hypothetical protein